MNNERWQHLERTGEAPTPEERTEGWHYCPEWDEMLIGPSMEMEWDCCVCDIKKTVTQV